MNYTSKMIATGFILTISLTSQVLASPPGVQGKHWAEAEFTISTGATVQVTATNSTINTGRDNKTRIVLKINDAITKDQTVDAAMMSVSETVRGNGTYRIQALCYNERADADTCTISHKKTEVTNY